MDLASLLVSDLPDEDEYDDDYIPARCVSLLLSTSRVSTFFFSKAPSMCSNLPLCARWHVPHVRSACVQCCSQDAPSSPFGVVDRDDTISRRTRAHHSLHAVSMDALEGTNRDTIGNIFALSFPPDDLSSLGLIQLTIFYLH